MPFRSAGFKVLFVMMLWPLAAAWSAPSQDAAISIVPWPAQLTQEPGTFTLDSETFITADTDAEPCGRYLSETLAKATGFTLPVRKTQDNDDLQGGLNFRIDSALGCLGNEGYNLNVDANAVHVRAFKPAGLLYACQTLLQLLPAKIFSSTKVDGVAWTLPCVKIEDQPRFAWRGLMLDPARFFLTKDYIKRYVDLLALHKMNRLHLHLTDSEAWTLKIEAYPELTNMDKWPGKLAERTSGIYTPADIREIVDYAASRNVTIIPEIELPAHSVVAMAAYPDLMCPNNPLRTGSRPWDGKSYEWAEYCASAPDTYTFIETVLTEVMRLFPSPYIHLGGDEYFGLGWKNCPSCQQQVKEARAAGEDNAELKTLFSKCLGDQEKYLLYRRLMRKVCDFVVSKGRQPMIWDDLSWRGNYPTGSVVNQWHYKAGMDYFQMVPTPGDPAVEAASTGHDVVASPFSHLYFDLGDPRNTQLVYSYEPMPEGLTGDAAKRILGPSAPAWSQPQIHADQMIFPRLLALSEVGWTARDRRNWDAFVEHNRTHYRRLALLGVKFPQDWAVGGPGTIIGGWKPAGLTSDALEPEWDASAAVKDPGEIEVIMLYQQGAHGIAIDWVALLEDGKEVSRDAHHGWAGYGNDNIIYVLPLAERKPGAKYTVKAGIDCHLGKESTGNVYVRMIDPRTKP